MLRAKVISIVLSLTLLLGALALFASSAVNDVPLEINSPDLVDSDFVKYFLFAHYDSGWSRVQLVVLCSDLVPFTVDYKVVGSNYQARINTPDLNVSDFSVTRMVYNVDTGQLQSIRTYQSVLTGQYSIYLNEATSREYFRSFGSSWNIPENQYYILPVVFNKDQTRFDSWILLFTSLIGTLHQDLVSSNATLSEIRNLTATQNAYISSIYNFLFNQFSFIDSSSFASKIHQDLQNIDGDLAAIYEGLFGDDVTVSSPSGSSEIQEDSSRIAHDFNQQDWDELFAPPVGEDSAFSLINPNAFGFVRNCLNVAVFQPSEDDSSAFKILSMVFLGIIISFLLFILRGLF